MGSQIYICADCAKGAGGHWPPGHIATVHMGYCDVCGLYMPVCSPRNWCNPKITEEYRAKRFRGSKKEDGGSFQAREDNKETMGRFSKG
jgi:hypothetical protein